MGLKKYLPIEHYTLTTTLKPQEICDRLRSRISYSRLLVLRGDDAYEGDVTQQEFKINRIIGYRNSFLPLIEGKIVTAGALTQIDIRMRMNLVATVFLCVWMGILGLVCLLLLLAGLANLSRGTVGAFNPALLVPFGMLLFGWALSFFAFKFESRRSKTFLNELLNAH